MAFKAINGFGLEVRGGARFNSDTPVGNDLGEERGEGERGEVRRERGNGMGLGFFFSKRNIFFFDFYLQ